jgi:phage-related protein
MKARRYCAALEKRFGRYARYDPSGTYRAVYAAQFQGAVYVLHAFQKKSKSGIATPQRDLELIQQQVQLARRLAGKQGD